MMDAKIIKELEAGFNAKLTELSRNFEIRLGHLESRSELSYKKMLAAAQDEIHIKINQDIQKAIQNHDSEFKRWFAAHELASNSTFRSEIIEHINIAKKQVQLSAEKAVTIYAELKFNESSRETSNKINQLEDQLKSIASDYIVKSEAFQKHNLDIFKQDLINISMDNTNEKIASLEESVSKIVNTIFMDKFKQFLCIFNDLKIYIDEQMTSKFIDKNEVNGKFAEIEKKLWNEVNTIIKFNLDQARNAMEQSASAEIKEGLKNVAADFLGSDVFKN